jgi:hypothetical protein
MNMCYTPVEADSTACIPGDEWTWVSILIAVGEIADCTAPEPPKCPTCGQRQHPLTVYVDGVHVDCFENCERLQGFPDGYTLITRANDKPAADGPRYKALGNSMAVPCMLWLGQRIEMIEEALKGIAVE